jgi:putative oxidoreductase
MLKCLTAWEERRDLTPLSVLFLRLVLAAYWGVHWEYKIFHDSVKVTEQDFTNLGFWPWLAWGDVALELFAVVALLLGLYVRTTSLLLLVILVPAMKAWIPNGLWAIHGGYEFPLLWLLMQVTLAMLGPGPYS